MPPVVPGRVVHIDADFLAYQVSAESADELDPEQPNVPRKSLADMQHNARQAVEYMTALCAGETYVCHLTPSQSDKGGRAARAVTQEYQANRAARDDSPEFLHEMRRYIAHELNGSVHLHQEADDGLAQANYNAQDPNLSVIVSMDKDLRMVPGLHWDYKTKKVINVDDPFGEIWIDATGSAKKCLGWGTKFFWAQCLMGDTADNIKGAPMVCGEHYLEVQPTKAYEKLMADFIAITPDTPQETADRIEARLDAARNQTKKCGQVMAYDLLKDCRSDVECFRLVKAVFCRLGAVHDFTHWRTGEIVSPTQALFGDMLLLWMRRNDNPDDVLAWLKDKLK